MLEHLADAKVDKIIEASRKWLESQRSEREARERELEATAKREGQPYIAGKVDVAAWADQPPLPNRSPLVQIIAELSRDERDELIALFWSGRGDGFWRDMLTQAKRMSDPDSLAYITSKAGLVWYLEDGLTISYGALPEVVHALRRKPAEVSV